MRTGRLTCYLGEVAVINPFSEGNVSAGTGDVLSTRT
jgi:hypothetical protein